MSGALVCPGCGAEARAWLVYIDGEPVAAADRSEVYVPPSLLREALGLRQAEVEDAERADGPGSQRERGGTGRRQREWSSDADPLSGGRPEVAGQTPRDPR